MKQQKLSNMVLLMRIMILIVVIVELSEPIAAYFGDEELILMINDEVWRKSISDLATVDIFFVMGFIYCATAVWLFGVYQIERLCRLYSNDIIFSSEAIRRFKYFAVSLIIIAFIDSLEFFVFVAYFLARDIIPAAPDISSLDYLSLIEIDVLLVAILFFAIASVMESGTEMQRDTELTI